MPSSQAVSEPRVEDRLEDLSDLSDASSWVSLEISAESDQKMIGDHNDDNDGTNLSWLMT